MGSAIKQGPNFEECVSRILLSPLTQIDESLLDLARSRFRELDVS